MNQLIAGFSDQLHEALNIANSYSFIIDKDTKIDNILIVGMGGSGIGGTIIQNYTNDKLNIPLLVSKSYQLPKWITKNTLVIACSYSGNTEETVTNLYNALEIGCPIIGITSGGKLKELLTAHQRDCIIIPPNFPPRSCLGYSFVQLLRVLSFFQIIDNSYIQDIIESAELLNAEADNVIAESKKMAKILAKSMPILYVESQMEGVAIRWKQQFNENGKMLCLHNVIPEMNHNELVGWREVDDTRVVLFLRNECDYERSKKRMDLNIQLISQYTPHVYEIFSKGKTYLQKAFYLINLGDWISYYLAEERGFDAVEVYAIDNLKQALA
jgi:glucose/mannose-6-phosphate isomerase